MTRKRNDKSGTWMVITICAVLFTVVFAIGVLAYLVFGFDDDSLPVFNQSAEVQTASPSPATETPDVTDDEIRRIATGDKIYDNITINNIDVSGLTKAEAVRKLRAELDEPLDAKIISFISGEESHDLSFRELGGHYEIEKAADKAYAFAREGDYEKRSELIAALLSSGLNYDCDMVFDPDGLTKAIALFRESYEFLPVIQSISRENGNFVITPGKPGAMLNEEKIIIEAKKLLEAGEEGQVEITLTEYDLPENSLDLNNAMSLLGSFKTTFTKGATGRNQNLATSASKINGTVLLPGEVFSTNDTFGEMTEENGYGIGQSYLNGVLVDDIGGGVCQVSSTLYCALLYSELEIVQRQNHSLKVSYLDWGYDATLATPSIDLRFRNNTDYPVIIESFIDDDKVVVNIYGNEIHEPGRRLVFENSLVSSTPPPAAEIREDPELPLGQQEVVVAEKTGYKYNLYKLVYQGDTLLEKVQVNTSSYRALRGVIRVGTKPVNSAAQSTEAPTEAPPPDVTDVPLIDIDDEKPAVSEEP